MCEWLSVSVCVCVIVMLVVLLYRVLLVAHASLTAEHMTHACTHDAQCMRVCMGCGAVYGYVVKRKKRPLPRCSTPWLLSALYAATDDTYGTAGASASPEPLMHMTERTTRKG